MQIMEKINDIREVIEYLKDGAIITSGKGDHFVLKNGRVHHYTKGTHYSLSIDEFRELYEKSDLGLYEEAFEIDETKDEAYYRYYRK